MHEGQLHTKN